MGLSKCCFRSINKKTGDCKIILAEHISVYGHFIDSVLSTFTHIAILSVNNKVFTSFIMDLK